jgi:transmembrane sensor
MLYNENSSGVERLLIKKQQNRISPEEVAHLEQLLKQDPLAKAFAASYLPCPVFQNDAAVEVVWKKLEKRMWR